MFVDRILDSDYYLNIFFYRTFIFDVFEILILFLFSELSFSIRFDKKYIKIEMVLMFTNHF
jgi:hypothetical protein